MLVVFPVNLGGFNETKLPILLDVITCYTQPHHG
jgi:hypothetical protein